MHPTSVIESPIVGTFIDILSIAVRDLEKTENVRNCHGFKTPRVELDADNARFVAANMAPEATLAGIGIVYVRMKDELMPNAHRLLLLMVRYPVQTSCSPMLLRTMAVMDIGRTRTSGARRSQYRTGTRYW